MGQLLLAAEYRDSAEPCFLAAQALMPGDMRWPYFLGHLYRINGATGKAAAAFERALALKSGDVATLVWLAEAYLDQGRPEAAEPLFARALAIDPRAAAASWGLGRAALASRDFGRAVEYLERTLSLDPKASIVHYPLALAYRRLGRTAGRRRAPARERGHRGDAGRSADGRAHRRRCEASSPWSTSACARSTTGILPPPLPISVKRSSWRPMRRRSGTGWERRWRCRATSTAPSTEFQAVLRRSPDFASTHYTLGVLIAATGRYDDAVVEFSAAVKSNPAYVEARLQLADALRRSGKVRESLPHYEQVARLDPRVADAALGYAMALVGLGRYQDAYDRLADAMKTYPTRPAFAHGLVRLHAAAPDQRIRDGNRALALARDLVAREQPNADLAEAMAMAMAETGRYEEAVTWQREAITLAGRSGRADLSKRMRGQPDAVRAPSGVAPAVARRRSRRRVRRLRARSDARVSLMNVGGLWRRAGRRDAALRRAAPSPPPDAHARPSHPRPPSTEMSRQSCSSTVDPVIARRRRRTAAPERTAGPIRCASPARHSA